ncbi:MAG: TIGR02444 family protein [Pseudohongiella sp.]|nr:TIGR02444 family protein [Pseudohongiella sp.]
MPDQSQIFWDFSVDLYRQEGVSTACLELQNEFGLDINLLMFCYWHGCCVGTIEDQVLDQVINFSLSWKQSVVQPLRNVRKWMKLNAPLFDAGQASQYEMLREQIKTDELAAEKYQQEAMERMALSSGFLPATTANSNTLNSAESRIKAAQSNLEKLLAALSMANQMNEVFERNLSGINSAFSRKLKA